MVQTDALFNRGMQPVMYSKRLAREQRRGWERAGENMKYHSTKLAATQESETASGDNAPGVVFGSGQGTIRIGAALLQAVCVHAICPFSLCQQVFYVAILLWYHYCYLVCLALLAW